ncbi:MAG: hypothetical protein LBF40_03115 [Deltaproteobacteria bacterium]|jgi:hypothetical protein|nr:hypothetical protein [Deltaproteobacteria bacterium]
MRFWGVAMAAKGWGLALLPLTLGLGGKLFGLALGDFGGLCFDLFYLPYNDSFNLN